MPFFLFAIHPDYPGHFPDFHPDTAANCGIPYMSGKIRMYANPDLVTKKCANIIKRKKTKKQKSSEILLEAAATSYSPAALAGVAYQMPMKILNLAPEHNSALPL